MPSSSPLFLELVWRVLPSTLGLDLPSSHGGLELGY